MNDRTDRRPTVQQLCETAADDPDAVTVAEIFDRVADAKVDERYRLSRALDHTIAADPSAADEAIERAGSLFASESNRDRRFGAIVVEGVAGREPDRATPAIDHLAAGLRDEDPFVRRHAVWALAHLSDHDPELVAPLVAHLEPDDDQPPYFEREHVLLVLRNVARVDPQAVTPMLPSLFDVLADSDDFVGNDGSEEARQGQDPLLWLDDFKEGIEPGMTTAELLVDVTEAAPEAVAEHVEDAATVLQSVDRVTVRRDVVEALAVLAIDDPAAVSPAISALGSQLDADDPVLQARAARALGLAFDAAPSDVAEAAADSLADLEPLLGDESQAVRNVVSALFSYVAAVDPERVEPFAETLVGCLDPEGGYAAANAAVVLGHVGDAHTKEALETFDATNVNPHVRETVDDAIARIDSREG